MSRLLIPETWHTLPFVRDLLCKIGRHDYEYAGPGPSDGIHLVHEAARLVCFYCRHGKISFREARDP
jgi:hypothetical protein